MTKLALRSAVVAFRPPDMARENDQIDRRLLALLQANARESVATLARKLGVARTTVQERISRLQKNGTIQGYSIVLQRDPFDQYADAVAFIATSPKKQKAVSDLLQRLPEIKSCHSISGDHNLMARIRVIHLEDMLPVIEAIEELPGVVSVKPIIVLAKHFDHGMIEERSPQVRNVTAFAKGEVG